MTEVQLYKLAYDFLLKEGGITREILDKHLKSENDKPDDLKEIYKSLCKSAQNRQMHTNVIGKSIGGIDNLGKVLFAFDPKKVAHKYEKDDGEKLLSEIKINLYPTGEIRTGPRSIWPQYCKSVIDGAYFLTKFQSAQTFYNWAKFFATDDRAIAALPFLISIEIAGLGFPLACDFLKEIGFNQYGKPDGWTISIFERIGFVDHTIKSQLKKEYDTLLVISKIAKANNVTSFAVDKIFWLIGSGKFHVINKNIGRQQDNFIKAVKAKYPDYNLPTIQKKIRKK